jgi:hypothetical protein
MLHAHGVYLQTFLVWEMIWRNTILSLLATWAMSVGLRRLRTQLGQVNIAKKTLVDNRFLS